MIKLRVLPEVLRVAILARHQLPLVRIVLMMALAALLARALENPLVHMAFLAIQLQMHTSQQKILMILGGVLPTAFIMALGTQRTIRPFMNILMTSLAVPLGNFREQILPFKVLRRRAELLIRILMAFRALHLLVLALQLKIRFLVVKFLELRKLVGRMAHSAGLVIELGMEHILVFVYVAFLAEPAVRPFEHEFAPFTRRLGRQRDIAGLVAFAALLANLRVPTGEFKSRDIMIKLRQLGKTSGIVTGCAGLFLEFAVELVLVNGRVTVGAIFFILAFIKVKFVSRLGWLRRQFVLGRDMAFFAVFLDFCMFPINLEVGDIMFKCCSLRKIRRRVALGTGHIEELFIELLLVDTGMTVHAEIAFSIGKLEGLLALFHMTLLAVGHLVLARQWKPGLIMEGAIALNLPLQTHDFPAFRRMALIAAHILELLMERLGMRRDMTARTTFLGQVRKRIAPHIKVLA